MRTTRQWKCSMWTTHQWKRSSFQLLLITRLESVLLMAKPKKVVQVLYFWWQEKKSQDKSHLHFWTCRLDSVCESQSSVLVFFCTSCCICVCYSRCNFILWFCVRSYDGSPIPYVSLTCRQLFVVLVHLFVSPCVFQHICFFVRHRC